MKARDFPGPANTMSRGSSPTRSVRTTCARSGWRTSTILTLSERWLTTQTSPGRYSAMATGSSPTGTEVTGSSLRPSILKISRRLSGVFVAYRNLPSAPRVSGRTCPLSNSVNDSSDLLGGAGLNAETVSPVGASSDEQPIAPIQTEAINPRCRTVRPLTRIVASRLVFKRAPSHVCPLPARRDRIGPLGCMTSRRRANGLPGNSPGDVAEGSDRTRRSPDTFALLVMRGVLLLKGVGPQTAG